MTEWCGLFLTRTGLLETAAHNTRAHFPCVNVCGTEGHSSPQHKPPSAIFLWMGCAITHGTEGIYRSLPSPFWHFSLWDSGVQSFHFTDSIFMHDVIGAAAALPSSPPGRRTEPPASPLARTGQDGMLHQFADFSGGHDSTRCKNRGKQRSEHNRWWTRACNVRNSR